jgi:hypothetical protein
MKKSVVEGASLGRQKSRPRSRFSAIRSALPP